MQDAAWRGRTGWFLEPFSRDCLNDPFLGDARIWPAILVCPPVRRGKVKKGRQSPAERISLHIWGSVRMSYALLLLPSRPLNLNNLENLSLHKQIRQVMLIAIICSPDHLLHPVPPHLLLPQMHHRPRPPPLPASQRCPSALRTCPKGSTLPVSS